jgi:hypothetical protein
VKRRFQQRLRRFRRWPMPSSPRLPRRWRAVTSRKAMMIGLGRSFRGNEGALGFGVGDVY